MDWMILGQGWQWLHKITIALLLNINFRQKGSVYFFIK